MGSIMTRFWDELNNTDTQPPAAYNAIVVFGYHGVGKDTLVNELIKQNPQFVNVKMSKMYKDFLKDALCMSENEVNGTDVDKVREQPVSFHQSSYPFSPLDVLNLLFHGSMAIPKFIPFHIDYALKDLSSDKIPVFTDIRRKEELEFVQNHYVSLYIWLSDPEVPPSAADEGIDSLVFSVSSDFLISCVSLQRGLISAAHESFQKSVSAHFQIKKTSDLSKPISRYELNKDYCRKLLVINRLRIPYYESEEAYKKQYTADVFFGLLEELTEFHAAYLESNEQNIIAEAGDVIAYVVLCLYTVKLSQNKNSEDLIAYLMSSSNSLNEALENTGRLYEVINTISSSLKRFFREDSDIRSSQILSAYVWLLGKLEENDIDLKTVLDYNIEKLTKRANQGTLFQGKGDNR